MLTFDELFYRTYSDSYLYDCYDALGDDYSFERDNYDPDYEFHGWMANDEKPLKVR